VLEAYREALSGLDLEICDSPWSEPVHGHYDLITPLVAWGYHNAPEAFKEAMLRLKSAGYRVYNPSQIVAWNVDKHYLRDLADAGLRIIPTLFVDALSDVVIAQAREDFGQVKVILKPVVSAGAKNTLIWDKEKLEEATRYGEEDVEGTKASPPVGAAMIQPFMPAIQSEGEWSLLYFAGQFSHAVLKTPKQGDFRSQPDYNAHLRTLSAPEAARQLAEEAIEFIGRDQLLYARVDMVRSPDGGFCLMELELIEPDLYLTYDLEASLRFKDAFEVALQDSCNCSEGAHSHD